MIANTTTNGGWPARYLGTLAGRSKMQHVYAVTHPTNGEFIQHYDDQGKMTARYDASHHPFTFLVMPDAIEEMFA